MSNSVSWSDARAAVVSTVLDHGHRGSETIPVEEALGRVLAAPVISPMDVPHYTSSAMDGFAIRGSGPWRLLAAPVRDAAGHNVHRTGGALSPGEALPVLTGSLLPGGTESVVRSEDAEITCDGSTVHATTPPLGQDIRHAGQERHKGSIILDRGGRLTPRQGAMLCAGGVDEVEVSRRPTVVCAFTGNEIVRSGVPRPGEVRDAFSLSFPALLESWGAQVLSTEAVPDDPVAVEYWLRRPETRNADIVIMTGGSGHSEQDFARRFITRAVTAAGESGEILAAGVACRPGQPTLLARRGSQLIVGVPGNPFAAHVALHSFVAPAVAAFISATVDAAPVLALPQEVCGAEIPPLDRNRERLIPARRNPDGRCVPVSGAHSHMLTGYATGDVLLIVPATGLTIGDPVGYLKL